MPVLGSWNWWLFSFLISSQILIHIFFFHITRSLKPENQNWQTREQNKTVIKAMRSFYCAGGGGGSVAKSCPTLSTHGLGTYQAPLSMGFSRQEYWSGLSCPSPGALPNPGIKPRSPALQADSLPTELPGKPFNWAAAAAAAKSLQSCPTLCKPIDGSPSGSTVSGILQARALCYMTLK